MRETKRVAQNTYSYKFSAPQMPWKIQNLFLKRAPIPYDYNAGLQIRDFAKMRQMKVESSENYIFQM